MSAATQWLLTYLLHGTVLLGGAALLSLSLRGRRLALQEAVIRAALLGGFVTASLQVGLGIEPVGGVLHVGSAVESVPAAPNGLSETAGPQSGVVRSAESWSGTIPARVEETPSALGAARRVLLGIDWRGALLLAWGLAAAVGLVRLATGAARLRDLLHPRVPLDGAALGARARRIAAALGLRREVPLHAAPRLQVPLVTGVVRPGVFLPSRALEDLDEEAAAALCAHELAHVARRDPAWILLARVLEVAVPFQPLHVWARRRLGEVAELLSDDLAVCASARPRRLARSLVDVASWTVDDPVFTPALAPGAFSTRSRLGHRVERLMDPLHTPERPRRLLLPTVAVAVAATALLTPVVSGAGKTPSPAADATATSATPSQDVQDRVSDGGQDVPAGTAVEAEADDASDQAERSRSREAKQRELEDLAERISSRAEAHSEEIEALEQLATEMTARSGKLEGEEMARLEADLQTAVAEMVEARQAGDDSEVARARLEAASRRMEKARDALRDAVGSMRMSAEEEKQIAEAARSVAESVRPTRDELAQIRKLSRELAEELSEHREELEGLRDLDHEWGETHARELRESLREMREGLRESLEAIPDVMEIVRSAHEAAREAEVSLRDALRNAPPAEREGTSRFDTPPAPPAPPAAPAPPAVPEPPAPPEE